MLDEIENILSSLHGLVERLKSEASNSVLGRKRKQFKTVCRSIEQLEADEVPVPDALRGLKSQLLLEIQTLEDGQQGLAKLVSGLSEILASVKNSSPHELPPGVNPPGESMSYTKPRLVRIKGFEDIRVGSWRDVLQVVCSNLLERHPNRIPEIENLRDRKVKYISRNPNDFINPIKVHGDLFVEGTRSADRIYSFLRRMMAACGESPDDFEVEVERKP